jgi:choline-sulfatase
MANITLVDRQIARMLAALEESGHADDTIIVVTSDHGDMLGDHGLLEKRAFYEESCRVPLLVHVPWLSEQRRKVPGSIGHIDLVPTLLELMGQPVPGHLQGESRAAVLTGGDTLDGNQVFVQWNGKGDRDLGSDTINEMVAISRRAIVTSDRWKLIICEGDDGELFDLNTDPFEMINLYHEPEHRDRVRMLTARLHDWQERVDDTAPLPS